MKNHLTLLLIGLLSCCMLQAQQRKLDKADRLFDRLAFHSASKVYADLAKGHEDVYVYGRLADCYRLTERFALAEEWYSKTVKLNGVAPEKLMHYGQALMANEKYEEAKLWLEAYLKAKPEDALAKELVVACETIEKLAIADFPCELTNLPWNSARSEFGPSFFEDRLLFCSDRDTVMGVMHTDGWRGTAFLDLYTTEADNKTRKLRGEVNSRYHEGPSILSPDGRIYLTRSNYSGAGPLDQTDRSKDGLDKLKIFSASANNGKYAIDESPVFSFNDDNYSTAHPSLDAQNLKLYFASDMPGGYGGVDLYVASLQAGEIWGSPVNLGPEINTPGDEMYPFIHEDGTLYFASNGHAGLGALDIFESHPIENAWSKPLNMGRPMNSSRDDFGLILNEGRIVGYMVSNRYGGKGDDDIYRVNGTGILLSGAVFDNYSGEKLTGATVQLRQDGVIKSTLTADQKGEYGFNVPANRNFELVVFKAGYKQKVLPVEIGNVSYPGSVLYDVGLEDTVLLTMLGQVINKESRSPVAAAQITVYNKCTNSNSTITTDEKGVFRLRLEPNCNFYLSAAMPGFLGDNEVVNTTGITNSTELASTLELVELKEDLVIEMKNIYYDYGKFYIREDAVDDLDKLLRLMTEYPSLKIELSSHTDARGSADYNMELSQKRAETCVDYMLSKGISKERLFAKGYGEKALKNDCSEGVECSEQEHQINRRTEFRVLSFDKVLYSGDKARIAVNSGNRVFGSDPVEEEAARQHLILLSDQGAKSADGSGVSASIGADGLAEDSLALTETGGGANTSDKKGTDKLLEKQAEATEGMVVNIAERPLLEEEDVRPISVREGAAEASEVKTDWWETGLAYSVQLATDGNVKDYLSYEELGELYLEESPTGELIMLGFFKKYSEAATAVYQCRKKGVEDAFVVTYKDGSRLK